MDWNPLLNRVIRDRNAMVVEDPLVDLLAEMVKALVRLEDARTTLLAAEILDRLEALEESQGRTLAEESAASSLLDMASPTTEVLSAVEVEFTLAPTAASLLLRLLDTPNGLVGRDLELLTLEMGLYSKLSGRTVAQVAVPATSIFQRQESPIFADTPVTESRASSSRESASERDVLYDSVQAYVDAHPEVWPSTPG